MSDISDSVCLNHPDIPAAARCAACGKPICESCILKRNGSSYCSERCAEDAEKADGRVKEVMEGTQRVHARKRVRMLFLLFSLLLLCLAAYAFYARNSEKIHLFLKQTERQIRETVGQNAGEPKESVEQGIPSSTN